MRIWLIWPQAPHGPLLKLLDAVGGTVVQTDDTLDAAEQRFATVDADVVLINSTTPGTQELATWIVHRRVQRQSLRWVVAVPSLMEFPFATRWLYQLLRAGVYDWVFEGEDFGQDLQQRLTTPWTWVDAVRVLGGPDAIARWDETLSGDRPSWVESSTVAPTPATPALPPADSSPPIRREVVVVSPAKPVIIAVAGLFPGMGATCTAVGLAERLEQLGQHSVLVELNKVRSPALRDWQPPLQASVAEPDARWDLLPLQRIWSYIVIDCHTLWQSVPPYADLVVLVGPGHWHRWGYWSDWERGVQERRKGIDPAKGVYVIAPGPHQDAVQKQLKESEILAGLRIMPAPDVFANPADTGWDAILAPVLPALPAASHPRRRLWGPLFRQIGQGSVGVASWIINNVQAEVERIRVRHTRA